MILFSEFFFFATLRHCVIALRLAVAVRFPIKIRKTQNNLEYVINL